MGVTRTPRGRWIEEGLRALAAGGPEAVRVEPLAQALGVTKGGFYGFFRNRDQLLDEMLDTWERAVAEDVIERVEREGGDARTRLTLLFGLASDTESPVTNVAADLAVRDWARRDPAVADRLRRVDNRRMAYLRTLFRAICDDDGDAEVRALLAFSLRVGEHFIAADDHGSLTHPEVLELTRTWLLR
ncbi:TetR/AcrR family transcriptional regulator [Kitasatospora sp. NPDC004240]